MKKALAIILCAAMMVVLAIPAMAVININAPKATIVIDAQRDDAYGDPVDISTQRDGDEPSAPGTGWVAWDDDNLYFYVEVKDTTPNYNHNNPWETDSVEIFIDWNSIEGDDMDNDGNPYWQIRIHAAPNADLDGEQVSGGGNFAGMGGDYAKIPYAARVFDGGYAIEAAMPIALTPGSKPLTEGATIKIAFQINDNQEDAGRSSMSFMMADEDTGNEWQWPHALRGVLKLGPAPAPPVVEAPAEEVVEAPAAEVPEAPAEPAPAQPAPAPVSPSTGNSAVMLFVLTIVVAGAFTATKRIIQTRA
ncbi:MAG: hypothetical protein FWD23_15015 [Oscillospiraceae bacterium]|nr:hypothetical protein [Oscillospiraceae bacterium]